MLRWRRVGLLLVHVPTCVRGKIFNVVSFWNSRHLTMRASRACLDRQGVRIQSHGVEGLSQGGPFVIQAEEIIQAEDICSLRNVAPLRVRVPMVTKRLADVQADTLHTGVLNFKLKCVLPTSLGALAPPGFWLQCAGLPPMPMDHPDIREDEFDSRVQLLERL